MLRKKSLDLDWIFKWVKLTFNPRLLSSGGSSCPVLRTGQPTGTRGPCLTGRTPSPTLFCSPSSGPTFKRPFVLSPGLSTLTSRTPPPPRPPPRGSHCVGSQIRSSTWASFLRPHGWKMITSMSCSPCVFSFSAEESCPSLLLQGTWLRTSLHVQFPPKSHMCGLGGRGRGRAF